MIRRESVKYRKRLALFATGTSRVFLSDNAKAWRYRRAKHTSCTLFLATKSMEWTGTPSACRDKQEDQIQKQHNGYSH